MGGSLAVNVGVNTARAEIAGTAIKARQDQRLRIRDLDLQSSGGGERGTTVVIDERFRSARAEGELDQAAVARVTHFEGVDLIVLIEAEGSAVERDVVGVIQAERGHESADADAEAALGGVTEPVLA